MGKVGKVGKNRKDRYYKLAKETGYRSRSSFKLLQLNRKFEFLQKSRVLVDLGAAPGGWLQVAHQSMPVSSIIIGVDLYPIRPIPNVITLEEDITTDKCRQSLKRQLKTWKADTILHDGAPNMGKNWLFDAFAQNQLTLKALKLSTDLLIKGGWFITKVFRSKDYLSLVWVFKKLFRKVHITKPQASRHESAEIFIVCEGYIAPDTIDPKFLDTTYVFEDISEKSEGQRNILKTQKTKPKAEGYEEGDASVFKKLNVSDFVYGSNQLEKLSNCTEIIFDDDDIKDHRLTTDEIKECCKDIKVLGKGDLKMLLTWRSKLRDAAKKLDKGTEEEGVVKTEVELEDEELQAKLSVAEGKELQRLRELKKKRKKALKVQKQTEERIKLKMIVEDAAPIIDQDRSLFKLAKLRKKDTLEKFEEGSDFEFGEERSTVGHDLLTNDFLNTHVKYVPGEPIMLHDEDDDKYSVRSYFSDEEHESEQEMEFESDSDGFEIIPEENRNPLMAEVLEKNDKIEKTVAQWYDSRDFVEVDDGNDIDLELLAENLKRKKAQKAQTKFESKKQAKGKNKDDGKIEDEEFEDVEKPYKREKKKRIVLNPEGLALGAMMVQSKKFKRDLIDDAYCKFAKNDEDLPEWFVEDEKAVYKKHIPVTTEMVEEYKLRLKEANARPVRRVLEAKARKKRKALLKLAIARKKAEALTDNMDMSEKEKSNQISSIYKKAMKKSKRPVTYVVAKKGVVKKRPRVKGRIKVVDKRLRKDVKISVNKKKKHGRKRKPKPEKEEVY